MKKTTALLIMGAIFLLGTGVSHARTVSQSFKIGAYLPPHIVTGPQNAVTMGQTRAAQGSMEKMTTVEVVWRDQNKIILQTTVVR